MSLYENFLRSLFGDYYSTHLPFLHSINLYCLFVVTLVITACAYTVRHYEKECENSFIDRVKALRLKYETAIKR